MFFSSGLGEKRDFQNNIIYKCAYRPYQAEGKGPYFRVCISPTRQDIKSSTSLFSNFPQEHFNVLENKKKHFRPSDIFQYKHII